MRDYIEAKTGSAFGKVDWTSVSPTEIRDLSVEMFRAANVSEAKQAEYFSRVTNWLYSECP